MTTSRTTATPPMVRRVVRQGVLLASAFASLMAVPVGAAAQQQAEPEIAEALSDTMAHLVGVIAMDGSGAAVRGAFLHLSATGFATRTDEDGVFDLGVVPAGAYHLTLHHPAWQQRGFGAPFVILSLPGGKRTELEWLVASPDADGSSPGAAIPLAGVDVTARPEVDRREVEGFRMRYVGPEEIAKLRETGMTVADLVRSRFASVRSSPTASAATACVQTRRGGEDGYQMFQQAANPLPDCPDAIPIIVDGIKIPDPSTYLPSLSLKVVESIEFVPGALAGARYGTGFAGGVLVIETRGG